jgi:hypothetical protein
LRAASRATGKKHCPLQEHIKEAVRICVIGFTGSVLHGLAVVAHGLTVHRADVVAAACQSVIEGVPVETRRCHGDQEPLPPGFDQMIPKSLCKTAATLSGVGKLQLATAYGGRRSETRIVFGFADIHSNEK